MKIVSKKMGIVHAFAQCSNCLWDDAIKIGDPNRMQNLRNRIARHIEKTGHTVILETGNSTSYKPEVKL